MPNNPSVSGIPVDVQDEEHSVLAVGNFCYFCGFSQYPRIKFTAKDILRNE